MTSMMFLKRCGFVLGLMLILPYVNAQQKSYDSYKVYRMTPQTELQVKVLASFQKYPEVDFWSPLAREGQYTDVMVTPTFQRDFEGILLKYQINYETLITNVEPFIQLERMQQIFAPESQGRITFDRYYNYTEVMEYLNQLKVQYPETVTLMHYGKSFEGRNLTAIKISTNFSANHLGIVIDAAIHGRDWLSTAQALYIIQELVENPNNTNLLNNTDWTVIPIFNPDGYEYTFTTDRLWRKTRTPPIRTEDCWGADPDHNFSYYFSVENGTSVFECSDQYCGHGELSEIESREFTDFCIDNSPVIAHYISLRSYGDYILYPYWCQDWFSSANNNTYQATGENMGTAILDTTGRNYTVGRAATTLYLSTGNSIDWMEGLSKQLIYAVLLPGGGGSGYDPPASAIDGIVKETFEGFKILPPLIHPW